MSLLSFIQQFPRETDCLEYFRSVREKAGITCVKCGSKNHYWLPGKCQFECACCGNHTSINSGTIMENTELPIKYWFITIHLLTSANKFVSSSEIQNQLGVSNSEPVLDMCDKLRLLLDGEEADFDSLLNACATYHPILRTHAS